MSKILRSQWSHIFKVSLQQITIHSVWVLQSTKVHIHIHVHMQNAWNKRHWLSVRRHTERSNIKAWNKFSYLEKLITQNTHRTSSYISSMCLKRSILHVLKADFCQTQMKVVNVCLQYEENQVIKTQS